MKSNALKAARVRIGYSQKEAAAMLNMTYGQYMSRETGNVKFTNSEKAAGARLYKMSFTEMNDILFDGILPMNILRPSDIKQTAQSA